MSYLPGMASLLEEVIAVNSASIPPITTSTPFHSLFAPALPIRDYLSRLHQYMQCSDECFILGLIYIQRLLGKYSVDPYSIHRVVLSALVLAAKYFDDKCYKNAHYAKVGGISLEELNYLELCMAYVLNFDLHVEESTYSVCKRGLEEKLWRVERWREEPSWAGGVPPCNRCC